MHSSIRSVLLFSFLSVSLLLASQAPAAGSPQGGGPADATTSSRHPNILVWMMDDVGFAQVSSFGGLVETPNIDRVSGMGLRYTNYHTAPICSAARAAFLTGRNPHSVHIGGHATAARDFPGYDAHIPAGAGTIAANLREAGYLTVALGKWDHLPSFDASPAGPFTYWPTRQGFERFYGFLAADADNWHPTLISDTTPIPRPATANYHLSTDLADRAIAAIDSRYTTAERRPFFIYWATGVAHAPHHAPQSWIDRYAGRFDLGWDVVRKQILLKQKTAGLVPEQTTLAAPPEGTPVWSDLTAAEKRLYARQMEVFAASLSHADAQFGRILDHLEASGELDNTLIVLTSDNGASAEGGPTGLYNEALVVGKPPTVSENLQLLEQWGGPGTYPHYTYAWAVAGNTPLRYYKQTTHEGGTRVPLVIAWPSGIRARGELREQFVHVTDIAPTLLEAGGVAAAATLNNSPQTPMEGESIVASFDDAGAAIGQRPQYTELYGNKGLWWQGWSIVTSHRFKTWDFNTSPTFDEPWELYNLLEDPGQAKNLAEAHPDRVSAMNDQFEKQAARYNVYPLHNLSETAAESVAKARADFEQRGGKWHYPGPVGNIPTQLAPPLSFRNFVLTADVHLSDEKSLFPVFAFGGQLGGIALYLDRGKPVFIVNSLNGDTTTFAAKKSIGSQPLKLTLRLQKVSAAKEKPTRYGISIAANERTVAEGEIKASIPSYFGLSETFGVGVDAGSPVHAAFSGSAPQSGHISNILLDFSASPEGGSWMH